MEPEIPVFPINQFRSAMYDLIERYRTGEVRNGMHEVRALAFMESIAHCDREFRKWSIFFSHHCIGYIGLCAWRIYPALGIDIFRTEIFNANNSIYNMLCMGETEYDNKDVIDVLELVIPTDIGPSDRVKLRPLIIETLKTGRLSITEFFIEKCGVDLQYLFGSISYLADFTGRSRQFLWDRGYEPSVMDVVMLMVRMMQAGEMTGDTSSLKEEYLYDVDKCYWVEKEKRERTASVVSPLTSQFDFHLDSIISHRSAPRCKTRHDAYIHFLKRMYPCGGRNRGPMDKINIFDALDNLYLMRNVIPNPNLLEYVMGFFSITSIYEN